MKIPKSVQADLALILITFVWGSTFTLVKQSLVQISPILFVALRFWVATAIMAALMPGQIPRISVGTLLRGLVMSVVLLGGFIFQTLGLRTTDPAYSAFITGLSVLLVPPLGYLLFRDRPKPQIVAGIMLASVGLFLLLLNLKDLRIRSGDVLTLICAVMFALQILLLGRFLASTDYRQLQLLQMAGSAIFCTILTPILETPFVVWNSSLVLNLTITGVLATALAFYVQARAQRLTTPNRAALIFSLEPFFAALFAYWILGHVLTVKQWLGGIMIVSGILVAELKIRK